MISVAAVKQHELGASAAEITRRLGIANQTAEYLGARACSGDELGRLREDYAELKSDMGDLSLDSMRRC